MCGFAPKKGATQSDDDNGGGIKLDRTIVDTVGLSTFTLADINRRQTVQDTMLIDLEKIASFRTIDKAALTTGNLGSAQYDIVYKHRNHINTDVGFHQYDNYNLSQNDLKYYRLKSAYNNLFFSPINGQANFIVDAKFSRNFANDVNLSLDFRRVNHTGDYRNQETKSTHLGLGFWKQNPEKNHNLFFSFLANINNENHNGGPTNTVSRRRASIPVRLSGTDTRHEQFTYALDNFFRYKTKYGAHHQVKYEHGSFHYADETIGSNNDSLVYSLPYIVDTRGLRYFMSFNKLDNTIDLSFNRKGIDIAIGLKHSLQRYTRDQNTLTVNDLTAFSNIKVSPSRTISVFAEGKLGLGSNVGNIQLNSQLKVRPNDNIQFNGFIDIIRYDPSLIQQQFSVTDSLVYDNNFSKTNEFSFGGAINWKTANLTVSAKTGIIDKAVSYDTLAIPIQNQGSIEYFQGQIEQKTRLGFIGIENAVILQNFTDNVFNLPTLYGIHSLYGEFNLFNKQLLTRLGASYYSTLHSDNIQFMPVNGAFYPAVPSASNDRYHYVETYANFKVQSFRIFVKLENILDFFEQEVHYQVLNHPQQDWKLRMGVRWVFRD